MSLKFFEDDYSNIKEEGFKIPKRKAANFNIQNVLQNSLALQAPSRLKKSITKIRDKRKYTKNEGNTIKDFLHSHNFGYERKNTSKVKMKGIKNKSNDSLIDDKKEPNRCNSMVYYPKEKNNKKIEAKINTFRNSQITNLKQIENLLLNKLNNLKFNFHQNDILNNINNDNNCNENILDFNNLSCLRSARNNISLNNRYYKNKFKKKKIKVLLVLLIKVILIVI